MAATEQTNPYLTPNPSIFLSFSTDEEGDTTFFLFANLLIDRLTREGIQIITSDKAPTFVLDKTSTIISSWTSVIVFSRSYATSGLLLDELELILACKRTTGHRVIAVFCNVDPHDFRYQTDSFLEQAFRFPKSAYRLQKMRGWKATLQEAANLPGEFHLKNDADRDEVEIIIKEIVGHVQNMVQQQYKSYSVHLFAEDLIIFSERIGWKWTNIQEKEGESTNLVPEFVGFDWIHVGGECEARKLKQGWRYTVHFKVLLRDSLELDLVELSLVVPGRIAKRRRQNLKLMPRNKLVKLSVGEFEAQNEDGYIRFYIYSIDDFPTGLSGLVICGAVIGPTPFQQRNDESITTSELQDSVVSNDYFRDEPQLTTRIKSSLKDKLSWWKCGKNFPDSRMTSSTKKVATEEAHVLPLSGVKGKGKMTSEAGTEAISASPQEPALTTGSLAAGDVTFSGKQTEIVEVDPDPVEESVAPLSEFSSNEKDGMQVEGHGLAQKDLMSPKPEGNLISSISQNVQMILGFLRDGVTRRVGIYGTGGIGKTTLLKTLFNHTEARAMFDLVIWVNISRHSSTSQIHNQVAEQVFSLSESSDTSLEASLRGKKVLFLLDDVLEKIDLDVVGIPSPNQENGCKIILTTRSLDVCHHMAVDKPFEMNTISMAEAWELFCDQTGEIIRSPDIEPYARAIVAACGGLPLTIIVTGRSLREENDSSMWQQALLEFLSLIASNKQGINVETQKLKFAYNKLNSRDLKDCFLYCALIQEDHGIGISELVKYVSDEGSVAPSLADPYERANNSMSFLLDASLLETTDDHHFVKMHDVVRELALVIMSTEEGCRFLARVDIRLTLKPAQVPNSSTGSNQFLLGAGAGLTEPPSIEKWEQSEMIFLMDNDLSNVPDDLYCPKLLILCLQRNIRLRMLPNSLFVGTPHLQILNLSRTRIKSLPPSLFELRLLKILLIRGCKRLSMLSPDIGALKQLQVLDLQDTDIYNVPNEIGNLTSLKHLLVSFYGTSHCSEYLKLPNMLISYGIILSFSQLNELSIDVYPGDSRWSRDAQFVLKEVITLECLKNLSFHFPQVNLLELFIQESPSWKNKVMTKFKFIVGCDVKRIVARVSCSVEFIYTQQNRCLRYVNGETMPSAVVQVLKCSTGLYLDHHLNIQSLVEFGVSNVDALEVCIVRECHEILTVIDSKGAENSTLRATFPKLKVLVCCNLWRLRSICTGTLRTGTLSSLKLLSVQTCPQLPFVLTSSMLQNLHNLEVLEVEDCQAVKSLIFEESHEAYTYDLLPKLRKLRLHYMPSLVSIGKGTWPSLEHLSFYNCPKLKSLPFGIEVIESIKEIKAEKSWWDDLFLEDKLVHLHLKLLFKEICFQDL